MYSPLDALRLAAGNPDERVVFLGIGFETTAPAVAASIIQAKETGLTNYSVFSLHKLTPPAMRAILEAHEIALDGILCPGHVSVVTGWEAWRFLPDHYRVAGGRRRIRTGRYTHGDRRDSPAARGRRSGSEERLPQGRDGRGKPRGRTRTMERVFKIEPRAGGGSGQSRPAASPLREEYGGFDALRVLAWSRSKARTRRLPLRGSHQGGNGAADCPLFRSVCTPSIRSGRAWSRPREAAPRATYG